jgi:DNA-directed RNA polymerase subunit RPC12/RpoP
MPEAKTFQCPNCGSPLSLNGEDEKVKCPYCGSAVIIPEGMRPKKSAPPAPSFSTPMYNIPQYDEQISKNISTAGKVAAGIAVSTMIAPIVITLVVFCIVGVFLVALFWGINSTFQSASQAVDPHALQTAIVSTIMPVFTEFPTDVPATEAPTATSTSIPISTPFARVLFHDNFSNKKSGWDVVVDEPDYRLEYVKGGYRIFINNGEGGETSRIDGNYKDMNVAVDVKYVAGPDDGKFGVTCRAKKDAGFYSFELSPDGSYSINKYTSKGDQATSNVLADGKLDSGTIDTTEPIHLRGDCAGNTLTLYLNNNALLQVSDSSFKSGGIGLIASAGPSGEAGVDVLFSNYSVTGK